MLFFSTPDLTRKPTNMKVRYLIQVTESGDQQIFCEATSPKTFLYLVRFIAIYDLLYCNVLNNNRPRGLNTDAFLSLQRSS